MNICKFRSSFRVYVVDSKEDRCRSIGDILSKKEYRVAEHSSLDSVIASAPSDPPHFVVLGGELVAPAEVKQILNLCPETHIVAVVDQNRLQEYHSLLSKGLYDVIGWPLYDTDQIVAAVDRGAERDYFMYLSEQVKDQVRSLRAELETKKEISSELTSPQTSVASNSLSPSIESSSLDEVLEGLQDQVEQIQASMTLPNAVEAYLQAVHVRTGKPVCFFKYLPNRRSLFLAYASGLDLSTYRGLGIDFNKEKFEFQKGLLRDPQNIQVFKDMIQTAFKVERFCTFPVEDANGVISIIVFLKANLGKQEVPIGVLTSVLRSRYTYLGVQNRLHNLEKMDLVTQVLNRENFEAKISEEISRSRRTHLPLSIIIIGVDQYDQIYSKFDRESIDMMMRSLAGMVRKNSRINDIIGRMNEDELTVLLPHTGSRGAAIKAERLRRMVEAADFTKIFQGQQSITISLGVSEYPSYCHDAEELVKSADDAFFQAKQAGFNKVCLAAIPDGFVADFTVGQG